MHVARRSRLHVQKFSLHTLPPQVLEAALQMAEHLLAASCSVHLPVVGQPSAVWCAHELTWNDRLLAFVSLYRPGQIWAFVLLAVVGGWVASVFTAFNTWLCLLRKKWSKWFSFRILEVSSAGASHHFCRAGRRRLLLKVHN